MKAASTGSRPDHDGDRGGLAEGFAYRGLPASVLFGEGMLERLPQVLDGLGARRALLLTTPQQAAQASALRDRLGGVVVAHFDGATMHTPVDVTERVMEVVKGERIDATVAFGGGSTIGLAKAIALRTDIPQVAVPTTYAGSEMTPILGQTDKGVKTTQRTDKVLPAAVIYDVSLTLSLPASLSGTSGINAIAHAVEALYAQDRNPVTSLMALEAIGALSRALPAIVADPADIAARREALYGAWLCGICLGTVGMALHHKLCHTLGGSLDLPHAETHTIVLPHALAYTLPAVPDVAAKLAPVLGHDPARALYDLAGQVGASRALADLGMARSAIDPMVERSLANAYWNPRPLEAAALRETIARAWAGEPPLPAATR